VRKWRFLVWLGAALLAVFVLGSLTVVLFTRTSNSTTSFRGPITRVVVTNERGAVTIQAGPAGQATVATHRRYLFAAPRVSEQLSNGTLTVTENCSMMSFISCSANFTITAPAGAAVNATAQRGLLTVTGMRASVYSNSESGAFAYTGASPSVTAYSLEGNISLHFTAPPRFVHARTETGNTLVVLPPAAYAINANSGIGTHEVVGLVSVPSSHRTIYASSGNSDAKVMATQ